MITRNSMTFLPFSGSWGSFVNNLNIGALRRCESQSSGQMFKLFPHEPLPDKTHFSADPEFFGKSADCATLFRVPTLPRCHESQSG